MKENRRSVQELFLADSPTPCPTCTSMLQKKRSLTIPNQTSIQSGIRATSLHMNRKISPKQHSYNKPEELCEAHITTQMEN